MEITFNRVEVVDYAIYRLERMEMCAKFTVFHRKSNNQRYFVEV